MSGPESGLEKGIEKGVVKDRLGRLVAALGRALHQAVMTLLGLRWPAGVPRGAVVVVALLVAVVLSGSLVGRQPVPRVTGDRAPVIGSTVVCPQVSASLADGVSIGVRPNAAGLTGTVTAQQLSGLGDVDVPALRAGQVTTGLRPVIDDGLEVTAAGTVAGGLEAEQTTVVPTGSARGLYGVRCTAPSSDAWFVGGASQTSEASTLVLTDVDDTDALVDVLSYGNRGVVDPVAGSGFTVPAHHQLTLSLTDIAPNRSLLAVEVRARQGRVASALRDSRADVQRPLGSDWVPQTIGPTMRQVVAGIPQGRGPRTLLIGNTGDVDTTARIQVTTTDGQFVPTDLAAVPVAAGTVVAVSLSRTAATSPLAVTVTSDLSPVVAGVQVTDVLPGGADFGWTGASRPLAETALFTQLSPLPGTLPGTLLLSAPSTAGRVRLVPLGPAGSSSTLPTRLVTVPAGRTLAVDLRTLGAVQAVAVEPIARSGPVYGARSVSGVSAGTPLVTLLGLQGGIDEVERPAVLLDPDASR